MSDANRTWRHFLLCGTICRHFWRIVVIEICILEGIFVFLEAQLIAHLIFCFLVLDVFLIFASFPLLY